MRLTDPTTGRPCALGSRRERRALRARANREAWAAFLQPYAQDREARARGEPLPQVPAGLSGAVSRRRLRRLRRERGTRGVSP